MNLFRHELVNTPNNAKLSIDANTRASHTVNPLLYGKFCEHLGANIYHGMEAQILFNCTFSKWRFSQNNHPDGGVYEASDREQIEQSIHTRAKRFDWPDATPIINAYFSGAAYGWFRIGTEEAVRLSPDVAPHADPALISRRAQRVQIIEAPGGIGQWIHLPLHRTCGYEFRIVARSVEDTAIQIHLAPVENPEQATQTTLHLTPEWDTLTGRLELPKEAVPDALYQFSLTAENPAHIVIERALLYPDDHIDGADPDIIHLLKDSQLPLLRWPGGNFVSGYRWQLGIGPVDSRPTVPNPAWEGMEFNLFGTDEFVTFCRNVGCEPMICINAGDGTPEEAAAWIEYCNGSTDTPMGRLRAQNGHPEPYNLKYWEVGNEIYGRWQVSWTTPEGNVDRYHQFAKKMLAADPSIQLLACGMGSYDSAWNKRTISGIGPNLRSLAVHALTGGNVNDNTDPIELYHGFMGYASVLETRYATIQNWMLEAGNPTPRLAITEEQLFARFREKPRPNAKLLPEKLPRPNTISEVLYHATIVNTCI
ncbi:MAG: alpha-N-arabinofuranosidase, partial [Candidatus Latescibacteria bacterium]|nr:alpha-N-arabinofuranosidase [Candidatus Latescibacterota bacterium]